jgi:hypothetical protein
MNHFDLHKVFGMESTLVCGRIALSGRERDGVIVTDGKSQPVRRSAIASSRHVPPIAPAAGRAPAMRGIARRRRWRASSP